MSRVYIDRNIQRAIETLKNEKGRIVFGISNEVLMNEREMKFVEAIDIAVSAMQELQAYRATGLTPRMVETLKENDKRSHRLAVQRASELDKYWAIGTPEECLGYKIHSQNISGLPSCNDCCKKGRCMMAPNCGAYCRINCYFWEGEK